MDLEFVFSLQGTLKTPLEIGVGPLWKQALF